VLQICDQPRYQLGHGGTRKGPKNYFQVYVDYVYFENMSFNTPHM